MRPKTPLPPKKNPIFSDTPSPCVYYYAKLPHFKLQLVCIRYKYALVSFLTSKGNTLYNWGKTYTFAM